jgi:hypothetical protein
MKRCVPLGRVVATPGVLAVLETNHQTASEFLNRHAHADWGDALDEEDRTANYEVLRIGGRLLSGYCLRNGMKLWIITEWDRSVSTVLLPSDY